MKKLATLLAAALVLAACGPAKEDPAQQYRDALPKTQAVLIGTPEDGTEAGALTVARSPLGDTTMLQSEYAVMSYYLALSINGGTAFTLGLLQFVTLFPPTSCDDASCTWGPAWDNDGLNRWKLTVTHDADHYDYALAGQNGLNTEGPWVEQIYGTAYPGADRDHGKGNFTLDFDAAAALDHGAGWEQVRDYGKVELTYDNTGSPATVGATFTGAWNKEPNNGHWMDAAYQFESAPSGGELQVALENTDNGDVVTLHTRWKPAGAGRADAHFNGLDPNSGLTVDYFASECWDGEVNAFAEVYDSKNAIGLETACTFNSAEYDLDISLP